MAWVTNVPAAKFDGHVAPVVRSLQPAGTEATHAPGGVAHETAGPESCGMPVSDRAES